MPDINVILAPKSKENSDPGVSKPNDARHLTRVQETPSKGLGVFALSPIPRGTRILSTPLLLSLHGAGSTDPRSILHAFNHLSPTAKTEFLALHPHASPARNQPVKKYMSKSWAQLSEREQRIIGIYDANSFQEGVYAELSRIHHDCVPNAHYEFNPRIERGTVHAVRDIAGGEEVRISYVHGGARGRELRQRRLEAWGFECGCVACGDTGEGREREERRGVMFGLDQELAKRGEGGEMEAGTALKVVGRLAGLLVREGVVNRELRLAYHDAARFSLELGNVEMAILWVEKEVELERTCLGADHPIYEAASARLRLLEDIREGSAFWEESMLEYFQ